MKRIFGSLLMIFSLVFTVGAISSCSKSTKDDPKPDPKPQTREQYFDGTYYHDLPMEGWETEVISRAKLLLETEWTPLAAVPRYNGSTGATYTKGVTYKGMPYSGVSTTYGLVGQNVSMYTFLSAIANPKSNMYNVNYTPTSTMACYYGTVCSTAAFFALGFPMFLNTQHVDGCAYFNRKSSNKIEDLEFLDAMNYVREGVGGHMMLITDVARDKDGNLCKVTVWESQSPVVHETTYTIPELEARFQKFGAPVYFYQVKPRYKRLSLPDFMEKGPVSGYVFPKDLCTERGDKVSIALGKSIKINILSTGYTSLELYRNDALNKTIKLSGTDDVDLGVLPTGMYKARLISGTKGSDYTYFEVGDINFTASHSDNTIIINTTGNSSVPQYITLNDNTGEQRPVDKETDTKYTYTGDWGTATNVRVHFAGKYGTYQGNSVKF